MADQHAVAELVAQLEARIKMLEEEARKRGWFADGTGGDKPPHQG